jgi:acetate kinase
MIVLALNGGSSSLKFGLYGVHAASLELLMTGEADADGLRARDAGGALLPAPPATNRPESAVPAIARLLADAGLPAPEAIGHRVVHGGPKLLEHVRIDPAILAELERARAFSPLHAPLALSIIAQAEEVWPGVPQIACFDTVFHAGMPDVARTLPLPRELEAQGLRRYGFHGLSCESIVHQLGSAVPSRLIIAHLGNGASVTAVQDGRSIDTSMGLTPSGGMIMSTRAGDVDPGILVYLTRELGYDAAALERLVDHDAGLRGISGLSGDMRVLQAATGSASARLAIAMFCLSAAKQIAAMATALNGVDAIVFTGGIGEHDAAARNAICGRLAPIGVLLPDPSDGKADRRGRGEPLRPQVLVLPSQENEQIARHCAMLTGCA